MHAKLSSVVRATAIVMMMVLAAIAVSSCGGGKSSSTAKPSPPASAGPTPSAGGRSPKYGGTLVVALSGDPGLLNPALSPSGLLHPVTGQIFDGLVRLDDHYNPLPDLARSWDVAKDGRTYTFHLARGVRWHDGRPFSSADVKYSYDDVLLKFGSRTRQLAAVIQGIDTPDANIVVFHLRTRYTPFLKWLDEDNGAILPAHLFRGTNPLTNPADAKPVGTGPFMFQSEVKGNQITLVRNPHYFERGKPYLDRIVFRSIPPPQALQAFQAGEVQLLLFPTPPDLRVLERMPGVTVTEEGRQGFARVVRMIPNLRRKPFDDVRVRQAISYAIDRPFIAKAAYGGTLQPATGPISSDFKPWYTDAVMKFPHAPPRRSPSSTRLV